MATTNQRANDAILRFNAKMNHQGLTDKQIRLVIATLRELIAERQRERASSKIRAGAATP